MKMTTKDRLPELKAAQSKKKHKSSTVVFIDNQSDSLDNFLEEVQQIKDIIENFQEYVNKTKKVQNSILFGSETDYRVNQELDDMMAITKQTLIKGKVKIEAMGRSIEQMKSSQSLNSEYRIRKTQHSVLLKLFLDVLKDYNESQLSFKDSCKTKIRRQLEIMGSDTSEQELERLLEDNNHEVFVQGIIRDTQSAKQTLAEINARHRDIIKIEKSLTELCDMFIELGLLVENQGEVIDRIDFQVLNSSKAIEMGNKEIDQALNSQSKSRKRKIIIIIIIILLIILAAFVIYLVL